ncbi:organelle RRM domain-containing protein 2, mitochondrial-like isoform X3 [Alnus glutinosa]|uniref:organelle RRM domain-containing protein 2, mitochondrial-like isoform X3 n=1 Tax=Alnus glutinosa TaxID=3517 RepID=UPI002D782808|nr:organelle RRM domain-containing protein 2, mitochondrial-like isoform X3 [Alnus glutinosa]
MALRPGLVRRFLSTSVFSSQSSAFASASASDANANDKRAVTPSTTLFVHARVARDPATGYSKGYGFVTYATLKDSEKGVKGMYGEILEGWVIFAEYAIPWTPGQSASPET